MLFAVTLTDSSSRQQSVQVFSSWSRYAADRRDDEAPTIFADFRKRLSREVETQR